jgi:hypothetical protein
MALQTYGDGSGFRLKVETLGSWRAIADGQRDLFFVSQFFALKTEGDALKKIGRAAIAGAPIRGAKRLSTSLRGAIFPKDVKKHPHAPAYVLGTNAEIPLIMLDTGGVIHANGRAYLLFPVGVAADFKQPNFEPRAGRLARAIAAMRARFGELFWRTGTNGLPQLCANAEGRVVVLFVAKPSVTIPKKTDWRARIAQAAAGFETRVAERTAEKFAAGAEAVTTRAAGSWAR